MFMSPSFHWLPFLQSKPSSLASLVDMPHSIHACGQGAPKETVLMAAGRHSLAQG